MYTICSHVKSYIYLKKKVSILEPIIFFAALVHPDNQMLGFLAYNPVDALGAIELARGEFLLVFNTLGVYVDVQVRAQADYTAGMMTVI